MCWKPNKLAFLVIVCCDGWKCHSCGKAERILHAQWAGFSGVGAMASSMLNDGQVMHFPLSAEGRANGESLVILTRKIRTRLGKCDEIHLAVKQDIHIVNVMCGVMPRKSSTHAVFTGNAVIRHGNEKTVFFCFVISYYISRIYVATNFSIFLTMGVQSLPLFQTSGIELGCNPAPEAGGGQVVRSGAVWRRCCRPSAASPSSGWRLLACIESADGARR